MNDRDEIRAGREALRDAVRRHLPALEDWQTDQLGSLGVLSAGRPRDVFLLSASSDDDSLSVWRSYGAAKEADFAINIDPIVELLPIQQNDADQHPSPPRGWYEAAEEFDEAGHRFMGYDPDEPWAWGGTWFTVEYLSASSTVAERELDSILSRLEKPTSAQDRVMPFLLDYLAGPDPTVNFKNPGFEDEREVRASWKVGPWWRFVLYRPSRFGITPYIEVAQPKPGVVDDSAARRGYVTSQHIDHLPIRAIRIGPTVDREIAEPTLRELLDANGYGAVEILESATPYR